MEDAKRRVAAKQINEAIIYDRLQLSMKRKGNMGKSVWLACPHCNGSMIPLDAPAFKSVIPLPKPSTLAKPTDPMLTKMSAKLGAWKKQDAKKTKPTAEESHASTHRERSKHVREEEEKRIFAELERARLDKERLTEEQNRAWRLENDARERELKAIHEQARLERERRAEADRSLRERQRAACTEDLRQRQEELWAREDAVRAREDALQGREEAMRVRRTGLKDRMDAEMRAIGERGSTGGYDAVGDSSAATRSVLTLLAYREELRRTLVHARLLARVIQSSKTWATGSEDVLPSSIAVELERLPECI